jgi:hypothetical protein
MHCFPEPVATIPQPGCDTTGAFVYVPLNAIRSPNTKGLFLMLLNDLYSLMSIIAPDPYAFSPRRIGTANHWMNSKKDFRFYVRVSPQNRGLARAGG